jgi:hypothetical protein
MDRIEVPEVLVFPEPESPRSVHPVAVADFLMTALLRKEPAMLHAEYQGNGARWFIRDSAQHDECIAELSDLWVFRAVLARFAARYMIGQMYGGHAQLPLMQCGRKFACELFMSNQGRTGFWIRVYAFSDVYPAAKLKIELQTQPQG